MSRFSFRTRFLVSLLVTCMLSRGSGSCTRDTPRQKFSPEAEGGILNH